MMTISIHKTPRIVLDNLRRLLKALQVSKKEYERTAFTLADQQMQATLLGHAQECKQYARELASQLEVLGGESAHADPLGPDNEIEEGWDATGRSSACSTTKEAMQHCTKSGETTLQVYAEVLREPSLHENIRKLIRYQINGLLHSFAQLSLLNASLT
jgi:hypothetical protein